MNNLQWVSIIAVSGWLVLALSALRAHRVGARKVIVMALTWAAIFVLTAAIFVALNR